MSENMENMEVQQPVEEVIAEPVSDEIVEEPKKKVNVLGIIGFVAGILSMVLCCGGLSLPLGIAAIVMCAIAMKKAKVSGDNCVLAIIGLILGILGTLIGIGFLINGFFVGGMNALSYVIALMASLMGGAY